jgi:pyruvate dehydrogenase complex dehydrogenase (E1) component
MIGNAATAKNGTQARQLSMVRAVESKLLWLTCWMINQANRREKIDGVKVGGHQASSASMVSLVTALYCSGMLADMRRDIGVLAVTSANRLNACWQAAMRARTRGVEGATGHIERLLSPIPRHAAIVTAIDGDPATLFWLGWVMGYRTHSLGVERFGQTGTVVDQYRHYGLDATNLAQVAASLTAARKFIHAA